MHLDKDFRLRYELSYANEKKFFAFFSPFKGEFTTKKKLKKIKFFPKMTIYKPIESPCRVDKRYALFFNVYFIIRPKKRVENGQIYVDDLFLSNASFWAFFEARRTKSPNFLPKLGLNSWKIGRLDNFLIRKFSKYVNSCEKKSQKRLHSQKNYCKLNYKLKHFGQL
jgi:hypothetical protein